MIDQLITQGSAQQFNGAGSQYIVQTSANTVYAFTINTAIRIEYRKSNDGGINWGDSIELSSGIHTQLSVWFDKWSGLNGGLIHLAMVNSDVDDVLYRSIDTLNSDTLSTTTTIFSGASTAAGGALSIARARGGNLGCWFNIDNGLEDGFSKSTDVGVTWAAASDSSEASTQDQVILLPGWGADSQDLMMFFWDASANEISRKLYDDSADSWSETSIAASMTDTVATTSFPSFAATVDITNSRNLLVAWSAVDTLNADLRCWHVTEAAITEVTNVVLNSVDDQSLCAISINTDNNNWYVFYGGKSDGSETVGTLINIYYKISADNGTTWGSETQLTSISRNTKWLIATPRFTPPYIVSYFNDQALDYVMLITDTPTQVGGRITIS